MNAQQMKQLFSLSIIFLFLFNIVNAQTSIEEYKYISKGLATQLADGLDPMKKSYTFKVIEKMEYKDSKSVSSFSFIRMEQEEKGLKAIVIVFSQDDEIKTFCIPHPDTPDPIWMNAIQDWNSFWIDKNNFPYLTSAFMKMLYFYEKGWESEEEE